MNGHRDLEGVYALVTSATSGIRGTIAGVLARHGGEVIVHGRNAGTRRGRWSMPSPPGAQQNLPGAQLIFYPGFGHGAPFPVPGIVRDPGAALPRRLDRSRSFAATEETTPAGNKSHQWEDKR